MSRTQQHVDRAAELVAQAKSLGSGTQANTDLLLLAAIEIGYALLRQIRALREDLSNGRTS